MVRRLARLAWLVPLVVVLGTPVLDAEEAGELGYYRQPAIHGDTIVFVAEGDLWSVSSEGGSARRLTTHPDAESHPAISPDGTRIAFTARYEGPREVYVMPIEGGRPTRLTFGAGSRWGGVRVAGWTPDGRILYASRRHSTLPDWQLIALEPQSGRQQRIRLSQAEQGAMNTYGVLCFTRLPWNGSYAKRYQGGTIQQLWMFNTQRSDEATCLTDDFKGTSKNPMLWKERLYHLSDRDGTMNLWSLDPAGSDRDLKQHTQHDFFDIREAAIHEGRVVYRIGADLHVHDLATNTDRKLEIRLVTDADQTRSSWVTSPMDHLTSAHLSPDGDRVVLTSRGRVFVAPTGPGRIVEIPGDREHRHRKARFSSDGKHVRYFSDETDEVELYASSAGGSPGATKLTKGSVRLRTDHRASPNGRWVAHMDLDDRVWIHDTESGADRLIEDVGTHYAGLEAWSPDGRWFVYRVSRPGTMNHSVLRLFDTQGAKSVDITTDRYDSWAARFDPAGKWLFFLSNRSFQPLAGSPWGARQPEPYADQQTHIYALALKPGLRPHFQEPDELSRAKAKAEKAAKDAKKKTDAKDDGAKGDAAKKKDDKPKDAKPKAKGVEIVVEGLAERLYQLPVPAGRYMDLAATKGHLLWLSQPEPFAKAKSGGRRTDLRALKLGADKPEPKTRMQDLTSMELSQDGKKLLVRKGSSLSVVAADSDKPIDGKTLSKGAVPLGGWRFEIQPRQEWRQMFDDAWRMHRDYFYDPGMHGVDWARMRTVYRPLVERVRDRDELQDLTGMLISELSALHAGVYGGKLRKGPEKIDVGFLGAWFERDTEAGGYRLTRLPTHDPDRPTLRSPLARPDLDVKVGDVLVAVDHRPALPSREIGELLRGKVGQQVLLRFARKDREVPYDAIVKPISNRAASRLRYESWKYTRRLETERLGKGRLGYIHLRGMGRGDMATFTEQYYPVFQREGLILDVRHNGGGNIDSWILSRLIRQAWMHWKDRTAKPYPNMQHAPRGHMIVLVDQHTASDGEAFADGFRRLGLGPVLGKRTWGGEVWLHGGNRLADGGIARAGMFGVFGPEDPKDPDSPRIWLIEGEGVIPDIEVDNLPHETFGGRDRQLEAAVAHLLETLAKDPRPLPKAPPYPDKSAPNNR